MPTKRSVIAWLLCANGLLLGAVLIFASALPTANAQRGGMAGDYVCVTAKAAGQSYDVLFLLDVRNRKLNALYPTAPNRKTLASAKPRDLITDFKRN